MNNKLNIHIQTLLQQGSDISKLKITQVDGSIHEASK